MSKIIKDLNPQEPCPIALVQYLVSGKWKLMILYHLSQRTIRFNDLQKKLGKGISQTVLTKQLRELEDNGLVHREVFKEIPPKVEYSLTDIGKTFVPVLKTLGNWGKTYKALRTNI